MDNPPRTNLVSKNLAFGKLALGDFISLKKNNVMPQSELEGLRCFELSLPKR